MRTMRRQDGIEDPLLVSISIQFALNFYLSIARHKFGVCQMAPQTPLRDESSQQQIVSIAHTLFEATGSKLTKWRRVVGPQIQLEFKELNTV
jgi:hypothetical protein